MKDMTKKRYEKPELNRHEIDMGVYGNYNFNPGDNDDRKDPVIGDTPFHTAQ